MSRIEYNPSYVCLYLDEETYKFYLSSTSFLKFKDRYLETFHTKINRLFPGIQYLCNYRLEGYQVIESTSEVDFLLKVNALLPEPKSGNEDWDEVCILYFSGMAPLLDNNLTESIWQRHKKFLSQYSYSENIPEGIIPRIVTREFIQTIPRGLKQGVHEFFLKNINNYDVEIFFEHPDLRQYRLNLCPNDVRSQVLVSHIFENSDNFAYEFLLDIIKENPSIFRSAPSWIELELIRGCELKCTFCPRQYSDNSTDGTQFTYLEILDLKGKMAAIDSNVTICLGGMGEPLLHKDFAKIVKELLSLDNLIELILETSLATNWELLDECIHSLSDNEKKKFTIIINLTTLKEDRYNTIYGNKFLKTVQQNIDKLTLILPIQNIHAQIIKILEVEDEVDNYFSYFEKKSINVIFQKYNSYAGSLEEKRVSDLTPLKREFCWHLTRDLYIQANGDVSRCKQVINNNKIESIGNIKIESLGEIWQKGNAIFAKSLNGQYDQTGLPCINCDEWYTFNS